MRSWAHHVLTAQVPFSDQKLPYRARAFLASAPGLRYGFGVLLTKGPSLVLSESGLPR